MNDYDSNSFYRGTVISQVLTETRDGDPQLRLGVQLTHKLKSKVASDGADELPEELASVKTLYFNFKANLDQLERTFRDLRSLGVNSPNIELLDPNHPKAVKIEGQIVTVKPRYSNDNQGNPRDWWNLVTPMAKAPSISTEALNNYKNLNSNAINSAFNKSSQPRTGREDKVPF